MDLWSWLGTFYFINSILWCCYGVECVVLFHIHNFESNHWSSVANYVVFLNSIGHRFFLLQPFLISVILMCFLAATTLLPCNPFLILTWMQNAKHILLYPIASGKKRMIFRNGKIFYRFAILLFPRALFRIDHIKKQNQNRISFHRLKSFVLFVCWPLLRRNCNEMPPSSKFC